MINQLLIATWQTILMVLIATLFGIFIGIPLGVLLFGTTRFGLFENLFLNRILGFFVNIIRSTPYLILIIALIPITRILIGTSIGTLAASVSLSVAAIMLYCRIVEDALKGIPKGLIEAAQSMGANKLQIISKVILPEALPQLISGLTLIIISLIGFSAMAGMVGGGGLGDLANRYGYQRYDTFVIFEVMVILIIMVQGVQSLGDSLVKKTRK